MDEILLELNVLAYQEGSSWVAQCIDHDIYAKSSSLPTLVEAFERALVANLCVNIELGRQGLDGISEAPRMFSDLFNKAHMRVIDGMIALPKFPRVSIGAMRVAELA